MARLIPNENAWIGFRAATVADPVPAQTAANMTSAVDLTPFLVSLEASSRGNVVATPSLNTLFETSIPGTVTATCTAEFYRDDTADDAWDALPRGTEGYLYISRFKGGVPVATDIVEVWPVRVVSRSATGLTNNESQRFTVEFSVPVEPNEALAVS